MKKILMLLIIGTLVMVGFTTVALGDDDDPVTPNRAPSAPIIVQDKSGLEKETYQCTFYSTDPDGDQVYYDVDWKKIDEGVVLCDDDDPVTPWLGPFSSGEEIFNEHTFAEKGTYKLTLRAKDSYDNISPTTEITVTYKKAKMTQLPVFAQLLQKFPRILNIFREICKL